MPVAAARSKSSSSVAVLAADWDTDSFGLLDNIVSNSVWCNCVGARREGSVLLLKVNACDEPHYDYAPPPLETPFSNYLPSCSSSTHLSLTTTSATRDHHQRQEDLQLNDSLSVNVLCVTVPYRTRVLQLSIANDHISTSPLLQNLYSNFSSSILFHILHLTINFPLKSSHIAKS